MERNKAHRDPLPEEFRTIEQAAEFWDTHDLTDYEDVWKEVNFEVNVKPSPETSVKLEPQVAKQRAARARAQKVSLQDLTNRVLKEYLQNRPA